MEDSMLEMVTLYHIKHKPFEVILLNLIWNWAGVPICTSDEDDGEENVHCNISGCHTPWFPFFLELELPDALPGNFCYPDDSPFWFPSKAFLPRVHH